MTDRSDNEGEGVRWDPSRTIYFDPTIADPQFHLGMAFEGKIHIIKGLEKHCVKQKREPDYVLNDKKRVKAVCTNPDCGWLFH